VVYILGSIVFCVIALAFGFYQAFMHSRWDASLLPLEREVEAHVPIELIGALSATAPTAPEAAREWQGRSKAERAKLAETWVHALAITTEIRKSSVKELPVTSTELKGIDQNSRVDAWQKPFCLTRAGSRVVVVSAGSSADPLPSCQVDFSAMEFRQIPSKRLYIMKSGYLVLFD